MRPRIRYPRMILVALTFALTYALLAERHVLGLKTLLAPIGYIGTFFAGMMYTCGFTAAPAMAILLLIAKEQNMLAASLIGAAGSLIADLVLFRFFKIAFNKELKGLARGRFIRRLLHIHGKSPGFFKKYIVPAVGAAVIASPFPDEIGISLLATSDKVTTKWFSVISYTLSAIGIFAILLVGRVL